MDMFEVANDLREAAGAMDDAMLNDKEGKAEQIAINVAKLVLAKVPAEVTAPAGA